MIQELVPLLTRNDTVQQALVAECLAHLATTENAFYGENARALGEARAMKPLMILAKSRDPTVHLNAVWALACMTACQGPPSPVRAAPQPARAPFLPVMGHTHTHSSLCPLPRPLPLPLPLSLPLSPLPPSLSLSLYLSLSHSLSLSPITPLHPSIVPTRPAAPAGNHVPMRAALDTLLLVLEKGTPPAQAPPRPPPCAQPGCVGVCALTA